MINLNAKKQTIFAAAFFTFFMSSVALAECEPRQTDGHNAKRIMDTLTRTAKPECGMGSCHVEISNLKCSGADHQVSDNLTCTFTSNRKTYTVKGKEAARLHSSMRDVHGEWLTGRGFLAAESINCKVSRGDSPDRDKYNCTTAPGLGYADDNSTSGRRPVQIGQALKRFFGVSR